MLQIGQQFTRWTVLEKRGRNSWTRFWLCRCECGTEREVDQRGLERGTSRSCGCLMREEKRLLKPNLSHGHTRTPTYQSWMQLRNRCLNPKYHRFAEYGGRGITVCDEWKDDFAAFLRDMGERPSPEHSIDRISNAEGYSKANCRWADRFEQGANRRSNVLITHQGETHHVAEWARRYHTNAKLLLGRLRLGWTFERAATTPALYHPHRSSKLTRALRNSQP